MHLIATAIVPTISKVRSAIWGYAALKLEDLATGTNSWSAYSAFKRALELTGDELRALQLAKVKRLLHHAYDRTALYRATFQEAGFDPSDVSSLDDLRYVPVLTRNDLQLHWKRMIARGYDVDDLIRGSSSGSTGEPVVYYKDMAAVSANRAAGFAAWNLSPWRFGLRGVHVWGNPDTVRRWNSVGSRARAIVFRQYKFPSYQLVEEKSFEALFNVCRKRRVSYLDGYTNALYMFALFVKERNLDLPHLQFVLTTGETIQDFQRATINRYLGKVFDLYGCSEINGIANECRYCGRYHVIDPHVLVEFDGQFYEDLSRDMIITDLDNFAFPLIRYKNGDTGVPAQSDCELSATTIARVSGRTSDLIRLKNGGILSVPSFFGSSLLKQVTGIKQYQIVRDRVDHLTVKLVVSDAFADRDEVTVSRAISDYLSDRIAWNLEIVDRIAPSPTGKLRLVRDETVL